MSDIDGIRKRLEHARIIEFSDVEDLLELSLRLNDEVNILKNTLKEIRDFAGTYDASRENMEVIQEMVNVALRPYEQDEPPTNESL